MNVVYLESITLRFPGPGTGFSERFVSLTEVLGQREDYFLDLTRSDPGFFPLIRLDFTSGQPGVQVEFAFTDGKVFIVKVENATGLSKASPHVYQLINLETFQKRLAASNLSLVTLDHAGVNLPWFSAGLHPCILQLRQKLARGCLYHHFPTGEPWDFILPGDIDEIAGRKAVDYTITRRPKFELVSFDKASTPLLQLDIAMNGCYEDFTSLFPEAPFDPELKNIWVYLENPYLVDVCLVINESSESDWSDFFKGCRL